MSQVFSVNHCQWCCNIIRTIDWIQLKCRVAKTWWQQIYFGTDNRGSPVPPLAGRSPRKSDSQRQRPRKSGLWNQDVGLGPAPRRGHRLPGLSTTLPTLSVVSDIRKNYRIVIEWHNSLMSKVQARAVLSIYPKGVLSLLVSRPLTAGVGHFTTLIRSLNFLI